MDTTTRGGHRGSRGGYRGRGRGRAWQREPDRQWRPAAPTPAPTPPSIHGTATDLFPPPEPVADDLHNETGGALERISPAKRPDEGGHLAVGHIGLVVNHFPIRFNPQSTIRHYDIDVRPEFPSEDSRPARIPKFLLSLIREKLFADNPGEFPLSMTAYDGEKNIFSAVPLPTGQFSVRLTDGEGDRGKVYIVGIACVNELKLSKLKDYLAGKLLQVPREILQGMDLVMKENPARRMISFGRSFYPSEPRREDDLGHGIAAFRGFQHSLKPTSQGVALSLDYSVLAFRKKLPVLDFLSQHIRGFNVNKFGEFRYEADKALKGLKVTVTHRRTKQKYIVSKLTDPTRYLTFPDEGPVPGGPAREVKLVDYFFTKYGIRIKYLDIPCLDLGKANKRNWVPMELCVLVEGQRYPKEQLDREAGRMLKQMSLVYPRDRQMRICEMVRSDNGPCGGEVSRNFGIEVDMTMTKVEGRVIGPPGLKVGDRRGNLIRIQVDPEKRQWNLVNKTVAEGKSIDRWAVIDFSSSDRNHLSHQHFTKKLVQRSRSLGIRMEPPLFTINGTMRIFASVGSLRNMLGPAINQEVHKHGAGRLQFLLCVMSRKDNGYKYLKWIAETEVGIVTQCCLSEHADRANDQYLANLLLKINAKLGGSNVELFDHFPLLSGSHYMFIGADVNHPGSRNRTSPSIAAVVGSINWPAANRYAARVRPQDHRKEKIVNIGEMCLEVVDIYARVNQVRPQKIILFRDGVSESQFDMVLNEELADIKRVFRAKNYNPSITVIVAQKRHQTRLFPERDSDVGRNGNVPPGTVVDTTIVHPFDFDFYLVSHYGGLGTSKPTHYYVLWDEHGFASDPLEKLIYDLCFTFARCTKPVSLVTPVYYADLAAYRGRLYHEAVMDERSPASRASVTSSSSGTSSSMSSMGSFEEALYKLHGDLENMMFFV